MKNQIINSVYYVGADDKTIDLFESQYLVPNGVSYNSYVIPPMAAPPPAPSACIPWVLGVVAEEFFSFFKVGVMVFWRW